MKKIILFIVLFSFIFINASADNAYVTDIKVDGVSLESFSEDKFEYEMTVDSSKESIKLAFVYDSNAYIGNGSYGDIELKYGLNPFTFKLINKTNEEDFKEYSIKVTRPDNRSSDNSLKSLTIGNNKVVLTDSNDYEVFVDGKLTSVELYAELNNDKASFENGYGERVGTNAIQLNNETTAVEVKIKAENQNVRTYKINIKKTNYKNTDATLKSLTIEEIPFDFKSNVLEYDLKVKYNVSKIKIKAIQNDDKASVEYKENESLKVGINNIEIKVIAEDSSSKIYKLNISREEEIPIVSDIKIKDIDFKFDSKTYSYNIETTLENLEFDITLSSETATSKILNNENLKNGSIIKIEATDGDDKVTYKFKIINKNTQDDTDDIEDTEDISTTGTNESNFFKENEMIISLIIFGIGIMAVSIALMLKPKAKK